MAASQQSFPSKGDSKSGCHLSFFISITHLNHSQHLALPHTLFTNTQLSHLPSLLPNFNLSRCTSPRKSPLPSLSLASLPLLLPLRERSPSSLVPTEDTMMLPSSTTPLRELNCLAWLTVATIFPNLADLPSSSRDSLEHLEAAFYKSGLQMYNAGAFNNAK